jgi:hypothetical protein
MTAMGLLQILVVALAAALLYYLVKFIRAAVRFKRSFDDFAEGAGQRLLEHAQEVNSTLERWHEYDEAYQEAVAKLEEEAGNRAELALPERGAGRGVTLDPTGGSLKKPN